MKEQAEAERKKGKGEIKKFSSKRTREQQKIDFFTLDITDTKLKKADWLEEVCCEGEVPECDKR